MSRESSKKIMINKNLKIVLISIILFFIAGFISNEITYFSEIYKIKFVENYNDEGVNIDIKGTDIQY